MPEIRIVSRKVLEGDKNASATALAVAVGTITYQGAKTGKILYLKPNFLSHLPADVLAYGRSDQTFPHDSTAEQWFTESQFESYRALGRWLDGLFLAAQMTIARTAGSRRPDGGLRKHCYFV